MYAVYLTHSQVEIDPSIPVPGWSLSEKGRQRTQQFAEQAPWLESIGRIVASNERKAVETAEIIAARIRVEIETVEEMGENDRSATGFLPPPEFETAVDRFFAEPEQSFRGWERAVDAQARIVSAVETLLSAHDPSVPLLIVGHGGVGTLLKCALAGRPVARSEDQGPGGGMLFGFTLVGMGLLCDWTPMDASGVLPWTMLKHVTA